MRGKVIYRVACGTCAVCITYSLASQAFRSGDTVQIAAAEWAVTPKPAIEVMPTTTPMQEPYTFTAPDGYSDRRNRKSRNSRGNEGGDSLGSSGRGGKGGRGGWSGEAANTDYVQSFRQGEEEKEKTIPEQEQEVNASTQQTETSGDPPTLAQFLSAFRCGGCRHNCCLLSPRCMKGRTKMQNATMQYQQTYGG